MAIVYSYPQNDGILSSDILVGTSTKLYAGKPINETKNFNVLDLGVFIVNLDINNLDTVLHNGNTSLLDANVGRIGLFDQGNLATMYISANNNIYTLKNVNANNTISAQQGLLSVYKTNSVSGGFSTSLLNSSRIYQLPDASGTIALTSDIPVVTTPTLNEVLTAGNTSVLDANVGTLGIWDAANTEFARLTSNDNVFYIKDSSNGNLITSEQGIFTLYKTNSIFATFNLGSILTSRSYTLPNASGTIALTSDIPVVTTPNLDQVLNVGNTSEVNAYVGTEFGIYDNALSGYSTINANDSTFSFNSANGDPILFAEPRALSIYESSIIEARIRTISLTTSRHYDLPDNSGIIALTSDIPTVGTWGALNYPTWVSGTPFVKMTAAGTFALDTNTYLTSAVTSVSASGLLTSTGGNTPTISTQIHTNVLVGRTTAGTGVMEEITVGSGLTLSAGTLSATSTGGGIQHAIASGTDTYTATVSGVTSYADGDAYLINFTNANTTTATLNINSLGAIPLYRNNDGQILGGDIWAAAEMLCVYNATANTFQCIGTSPNSLFAYVTNADSVAITKGQPVYAFGGQGDRLTVKRALNTSDATSAQTVGVVLTSSIAVNQKGIIIIQGLLDGLSILPTSTWADGDPVYLGTTAGSITNVKQYAPNHLVYLGTVTTASNGSAGRWYVRVQNGYELDELHNVQAQSPSLKDTLWYDSGVTPGQWKTASISSILGYTPADDSLVVHKAGTETITGLKTFTNSDLIFDNPSTNQLNFLISGITEGLLSVSNSFFQFRSYTSGGYLFKNTAGSNLLSITDAGVSTFLSSVTASSLIKSGGTSSEFLKADGSVDSTSYQSTLVSGTNIKTINGSSVLGSGNLTISGGILGIHALLPLSSGSQTSSSMQSMTGGTGQIFTGNRLIAYPFIPAQSFTSSNLQINVTSLAAGSLGRIAVYNDLNGVPDTSIFISSDLDLSTTGIKTATTSISFVAGTTYWLAFHGNATVSTLNSLTAPQMIPLRVISVSSVANYLYRNVTYTSGTPTTFGAATYAAGNIALIYITKA